MLAIIISIITTAIISYIFFKWQNKKNTIVHFTINTYDIGSGLSNDFPGFKLSYDSSELSNSVKVLTGGFMNNGKKDIPSDPSFELILPEKCRIKALKTSPSDKGMAISHTIDNTKGNVVCFSIKGIFKSDEYINYKMIVETPENIGELDDKLCFNHRIVNTDKINNIFVRSTSEKAKWKRRIWIGYIFILLIGVSLVCLNPKMNINVYNSDNKKVNLHVSPNSSIYEKNVFWGKKVSEEELESNYHFSPITTFKDYVPQIYIYGGMILIIIILFMMATIDFSGEKHVINVLKKTETEKKKK